MKFRKKPVVIDAIQLTWKNWNDICEFVGVGLEDGKPHGFFAGQGHLLGLKIPTLEGVMEAIEFDWIIKGVKGEFYACKPDIFEMTYEKVEE